MKQVWVSHPGESDAHSSVSGEWGKQIGPGRRNIDSSLGVP